MNIFVLDNSPVKSAQMMCDKHIPKMCVESLQMMGSALRRHGATDEQMPLSEAGKPIKGGYKNHPCTRWSGDSRENFLWLSEHALALCAEYNSRYGKEHKCHKKISKMMRLSHLITNGPLTRFAQAMPDEYKSANAIDSYRRYYIMEKAYFAKWERGREKPDWFVLH